MRYSAGHQEEKLAEIMTNEKNTQKLKRGNYIKKPATALGRKKNSFNKFIDAYLNLQNCYGMLYHVITMEQGAYSSAER